MSKGGKTARARADAAAELQLAGKLLEGGRYAEALPLLERAAPILMLPAVEAAIGDCLHALGKPEAALEAYQKGLAQHPQSPELALRLASRSLDAGLFLQALPAFQVARATHRRDASFLQAYAYAALQAERWPEAEEQARAALEVSKSDDARLLLGLALAAQERLAEAAAVLEETRDPPTRTLAARFHGLGGNLARALELYIATDDAKALGPSDWAHAAQVAALSGARERAERWLAEAQARDPGPSTELAAAQLALLLGQPERALKALEPLISAESHADRDLATALTARAHRLAERPDQAREVLAALSEGAPPRVRALAEVDRGHLDALAGDFEAAEAAFRAALAHDPSDPEAQRGLALAQQKLTWKREVLADASKQVDAARAEAEAVRRAVADREGELARLRRQLAELERQRQAAEKQARAAQADAEAAQQRAESERKAALQAELQAREAEALANVEAEISRAFDDRVPEAPAPLVAALRVAELNYQKALQTDLPGAGVAVLYSGVLERALYVCMVTPLERWLDDPERRRKLLEPSKRGERGGRPEYADKFVGAFDREHPLKAPGLGEVARALRKRREPHLAVLNDFLETQQGWPAAFLDALAEFVDESKVKLRDPIAHGRILEIDDRAIAALRKALLHAFADGKGVLFRLAFPRG
ncbi:MAG: tetratricopeptide repeat protein [Deltaproteobacteria bacterium]|nr:tetratricopeptide repeat protein [Deltaproteobacteria bacterium]